MSTYERCPFCQNIYQVSGFFAPGEEIPEDLKRLLTLTEADQVKMFGVDPRYRDACGRCLSDGLRAVEAFEPAK